MVYNEKELKVASKEKSIRVWLPPVVNKEYELYDYFPRVVNEEKDRQFQVHVRVVGVALACEVSGILVPGKLFCEAARNGIQIDLYTQPSRGSAAKTIQQFHANPASYAG